MHDTPDLSKRGASLVSDSPMAPYILEHFERSIGVDDSDPDRYIGLCIAQNLLMWDILETHINRDRGVAARSVAYDDMTGSQTLRDEIAAFGSRHLWGRTVEADQIVAMAGAGTILETLFYAICEPGDGVLVPTPSYVGFWADLETRDELTIVPVHTSSADNFRLTPNLLEEALASATVPVSALMLTNPDNPTGRVMPSSDIAAAVAWARSHDLPIVMNNIYALSVHGNEPFVPTASIVDHIGTDIHEVWGFSKDFAMSGVRCGVLATNNTDVAAAMDGLAYWSAVSGDTQHLLANMLADHQWRDLYVATMRTRLRSAYDATTSALDAGSIRYIDAEAGLFVLADFRPFLDEPTWEAEHALWQRLLDEANVNVTPGSACHIGEPGFMRICFATEPADVVAQAITRIHSVLA